MPQIKAICMSDKKGPKKEISSIKVIENFGIENDFHAKRDSDRQISILSDEIFQAKKDELIKNNIKIEYGAFGENIIIEGIEFDKIRIGTKFIFNSGVELEIKVIGKNCPSPCIIHNLTGSCIMPQYGIFCRVLKGGVIKNGDRCYYC